MTIARIHGTAPAAAQRTGATPSQSPNAPFQVRATPAGAVPASTSPLDAFRRGNVTQDQYVDAKVAQAMDHLQGLPAKQRAIIADELRTRLVGGDLAHVLAGVGA